MAIHTEEQFDKQRRLKNTYAEANLDLAEKLDKLRRDHGEAEKTILRLEAELAAERSNLLIIGTDNNTRYRAFEEEVLRLRGLLRENGIKPD